MSRLSARLARLAERCASIFAVVESRIHTSGFTAHKFGQCRRARRRRRHAMRLLHLVVALLAASVSAGKRKKKLASPTQAAPDAVAKPVTPTPAAPATNATARGPYCRSGLTGDYAYESCGKFCKEAKAENHCAVRPPHGRPTHSSPTRPPPASAPAGRPTQPCLPPRAVLQVPRVRLLQGALRGQQGEPAARLLRRQEEGGRRQEGEEVRRRRPAAAQDARQEEGRSEKGGGAGQAVSHRLVAQVDLGFRHLLVAHSHYSLSLSHLPSSAALRC